MIQEHAGNLLTSDADALVNTVNTVGVMGKGIALQFKRAYPQMFKEYERAAKAGEVTPGRMHVWESHSLEGPRFIINFPTKRHWRGPSRIDYVRDGLDDLARVIADRNIRSIAVPPLGCGNGGLDWDVVRALIEEHLGGLTADVIIYPPFRTPTADAMLDRRALPTITPGRAALLRIMLSYQERTFDAPSVVEVQKLMYFLQMSGEPLRLNFTKGLYGPYADNLRHVLVQLEGHYIVGFGDGSSRVNEAEPLRLLKAGASASISAPRDTAFRVGRVLELTSGFASAYGLELLASTHWVAMHDDDARTDPERAADLVRAWTHRKNRLFTRAHLERAWYTLLQRGWLSEARVA